MLGLTQKIRRHEGGVRAAVGNDQNFARTCNHIDGDLTKYLLFCLGDICAAGPDDFVHARHALGAVGQRGDRLRAAELEDAVDAGQLRRCKNDGADCAACGGRDHDELSHAGKLCRDAVHQNGGRVARRAARHIHADPFERNDALAEYNAVFAGEHIAASQLFLVIGADILRRTLHHGQKLRRNGCARGSLLRLAHLECVQLNAVKFLTVCAQRVVAASSYLGDDFGHGLFHAAV